MRLQTQTEPWRISWTTVNARSPVSNTLDLSLDTTCVTSCEDSPEQCRASPYRQQILELAGAIVDRLPRRKRKINKAPLESRKKRTTSENTKPKCQSIDDEDGASADEIAAKELPPMKPKPYSRIILKVTKPRTFTFKQRNDDKQTCSSPIALKSMQSKNIVSTNITSENGPLEEQDLRSDIDNEFFFDTDSDDFLIWEDISKAQDNTKPIGSQQPSRQHETFPQAQDENQHRPQSSPASPQFRADIKCPTSPASEIELDHHLVNKTAARTTSIPQNSIELPLTPMSIPPKAIQSIKTTEPTPPMRPFMRRFPSPILPASESPMNLFKPEYRILTCFRIAEVLRLASKSASANPPTSCPTIELFARVIHSERHGDIQTFQFADLFFPQRPPYLHGEFEGWKESKLFDADSKVFLTGSGKTSESGKLCRTIIDVKPRTNSVSRSKPQQGRWIAQISTIWESDWEEIQLTKDIVEPDLKADEHHKTMVSNN